MVKAAILHEGNDKDTTDKKLLKNLLLHLSLDAEAIQFEGFGNKSNFFNRDNPKYSKLKSFIETGLINKLLFIVDADYEKDDAKYKGFTNTENALTKLIGDLGFQGIADFYIVCDPISKTGYLESLLLASLPEDKRNCIEAFAKCSDINPKQIHKTLINNIYEIAYPDPPYNFEHSHFDGLKAKLSDLFA